MKYIILFLIGILLYHISRYDTFSVGDKINISANLQLNNCSDIEPTNDDGICVCKYRETSINNTCYNVDPRIVSNCRKNIKSDCIDNEDLCEWYNANIFNYCLTNGSNTKICCENRGKEYHYDDSTKKCTREFCDCTKPATDELCQETTQDGYTMIDRTICTKQPSEEKCKKPNDWLFKNTCTWITY